MGDSRIAIYSCYYGPNNENTFAQIDYEDYDCYFITNNRHIANKAQKKNWNIIYDNIEISPSKVVNAFNSKKAKCMPETYKELINYDYLIYVDDKKVIDPRKIINLGLTSLGQSGGLSIRMHPKNYSNIWCEFGVSLLQDRYRVNRSKMYNYINDMLSSGYSEEGNIYWTSLILRDMNHPKIHELNEEWYNHVKKCGIECQISFFFIAQKYDIIRTLPSKELGHLNYIDVLIRLIYGKIRDQFRE